jgi:hypothetical protein
MQLPRNRSSRRRSFATSRAPEPVAASRLPEPLAVSPAPAPEPVAASRDARALATIVAAAFARAGVALRIDVLRRLLGAVGPLALAVVGGGAFAKYLHEGRWPGIGVTLEDAARTTSAQVFELARYVEQSNPDVVAQTLDALARDATVMGALGASVAALVIERLAERRSANRGPR